MELAVDDVVELAEMLWFIGDWLGGADEQMLAASFRRFMDADGCDLAELRSDLARFTFLIDGSDGEDLFEPEHQ
ncbi:hypothetical protein Caci_3926 [Catenulispora acidiphila DSM 44928]|uniref:Uncharacterized protein n=1 Tax=Catenulispora acidiphila (strain DSM 44928 / JCM 14897 / NBRC 102108 / NRRL B-24433 / ID139908) TaxID=479433 RepID=C7QEP2_CATAD|nr:hypothetical protein [Catenulispora acidiphila]ACU72812.1 hypothetical protein Caci_3926 [Catenulispora acidiphila DSM 44928]